KAWARAAAAATTEAAAGRRAGHAAGRRTRGSTHARRRTRRLGTATKLEPVDLADNGIARHAFTEHSGNLAGAEPFHPKLLEQLDALFSPALQNMLQSAFGERNPSTRRRREVRSVRHTRHRRSFGSATRDIVFPIPGYYTGPRILIKSRAQVSTWKTRIKADV